MLHPSGIFSYNQLYSCSLQANHDIFYNILLHCDTEGIKNFYITNKYIKQILTNHFWIAKYQQDCLRLPINSDASKDNYNDYNIKDWMYDYTIIKNLPEAIINYVSNESRIYLTTLCIE